MDDEAVKRHLLEKDELAMINIAGQGIVVGPDEYLVIVLNERMSRMAYDSWAESLSTALPEGLKGRVLVLEDVRSVAVVKPAPEGSCTSCSNRDPRVADTAS